MAYYGYKPAEQAIQIGDNTIVSADIADGSIVNADVNSSAAIAMSKTALVGGTGLTLSTNTLNVDAAQTQITSVGTLTGLTVQASDPSVSSYSHTILNVKENDHTAIQISTPNDKIGFLLFGDSNSATSGQVAYNHSTPKLYFATEGTEALSIDGSQNATFAGTVTGGNGSFTNLTINATEKLRFDGAGGHTYIEEDSNDTLIFATGGTTRLTLGSNATFAGEVKSQTLSVNSSSTEFPVEIDITSSTEQQVALEVRQMTSGNDARFRFKNSADSGYCRFGMESDGDFFIEPFTGSGYAKHFHLDAVTGNATFGGDVTVAGDVKADSFRPEAGSYFNFYPSGSSYGVLVRNTSGANWITMKSNEGNYSTHGQILSENDMYLCTNNVETAGNYRLKLSSSGATFTGAVTVGGSMYTQDIRIYYDNQFGGRLQYSDSSNLLSLQANEVGGDDVEIMASDKVFLRTDAGSNTVLTSDGADATFAGRVGIGATPISSSSKLWVVESESVYALRVQNTRNPSSSAPYCSIFTFTDGNEPNNSTSEFLHCNDSAATRMIIYSNGGIANYQSNDYNMSDERLKEDIVNAPNALANLNALTIRNFKYIGQEDDTVHTGLIAQEVEEVIPTIVKDAMDDMKGIKSVDLQYMMLKAIQELSAKVTALENA